jgi:DNA processing protein
LRALVDHFNDTAAVLAASARALAAVDGIGAKLASSIAYFRRQRGMEDAWTYADRQLSRLNAVDGTITSYWDGRYPELLKRIYDPPPFLFTRGAHSPQDRYAVAVVGTRRPTEYGITVACEFSAELARRGITVVSGLARGVDTAAHESALKAGGRSIAAIGSGLDVIYPPENRSLFRRIALQGAILSEYAMGSKPDAANFPRRNRIISGLGLGTVVIETDRNGGAMITAHCALEQNREVFAVPGSIKGKYSRGCNALIREGSAKLVECIDDILIELSDKLPRGAAGRATAARPSPVAMTLFEQGVYGVLARTPVHVDEIAAASGLPAADALVHLLTLECKGLVVQRPGKLFMKS